MKAESDATTERLAGLVLTFLGGVAIGLLLSSGSGRRARARISRDAVAGGQWVEEIITSAGEQVADSVRHAVQDVLEQYVPSFEERWDEVADRDLVRALERLPGR